MNNLNYPANRQQGNSAGNANVGNIKSREIDKERCDEIDNIPLNDAIVQVTNSSRKQQPKSNHLRHRGSTRPVKGKSSNANTHQGSYDCDYGDIARKGTPGNALVVDQIELNHAKDIGNRYLPNMEIAIKISFCESIYKTPQKRATRAKQVPPFLAAPVSFLEALVIPGKSLTLRLRNQ